MPPIPRSSFIVLHSSLLLLLSSLAFAQADPLSPPEIQKRILAHRTAQTTLTILTPDGKPLANTPVVLRQTRHQFLFGCNAFAIDTAKTDDKQLRYQKQFAEIFNFATLPFYWVSYERTRDHPDVQKLTMIARWCQQNNIRPKGHPLCWHNGQPRWLVDFTPDQALPIQLARITRDVTAFAPLIDTWDVVNEACVMPTYKKQPGPLPALCQKIGAVELIKQTFAEARKANPAATLLLNDYNTGPAYEKLVADSLAAGVSIDAIGIQSHMHSGFWGSKKIWEVCQRFARFNKPLHFTESTIISGDKKKIPWNESNPHLNDWPSTPDGEQRQAQQVEEFYTLLFSHPSVAAITWWDFNDGAWLGAPAGLVRKDISPKPAYQVLQRLIKKEWWTAEVKATTDAAGTLHFRGYLGDYSLQSPSSTATFTLSRPGDQTLTTRLK